jgi:hypothetical protein
MSRITTLLNYNENADQRPYRFFLIHQPSWFPIIYELKNIPDGWDDEIVFERNSKYKGVFRKYADGELKFPKDGRRYLLNVYEQQGITAQCTLLVQKLVGFEYVNHFSGSLDFSTYKIDELFVSIQCMDNSFSEIVKNREKNEVNLLDDRTIDGTTLPELPTASKSFVFPQLIVSGQAEWDADEYQIITGEVLMQPIYERIDLDLGLSELDEAEDQTPGTGTDYFYRDAPNATDCRCHLSMSGQVEWDTVKMGKCRLQLVLIGGDATQVLYTSGYRAGGSFDFSFNNVSDWFAVSASANLKLDVRFDFDDTPEDNTGVTMTVSSTSMKFEVELLDISPQQVTGLPYYEALMRTCQKISNKTNAFYSEFFGRTDTPIETYLADGQLGHITKGAFIRALDKNIDNIGLSVTLDELFRSMDSLFCLGLGVENDPVEGYRVRVEELDYWFDDTVVLDLSDRISEDEIGKEVLPDWHYAQVKVGFKKFKYEIDGGIFEKNSLQTYSTRIGSLASFSSTLNLENPYRGDTNGIIISRKEYETDNSEDVDGDEDVFVVDTRRMDAPNADKFQAKRDEGFRKITGLIDNEQYYNYLYTPKRCLLRWGKVIRAGLERVLNSYLFFQSNDKQVDLTTRLTTEVDDVVESADVMANDLTEPLWWAEAYTITAPLYKADIDLLEANPRGLIKLADEKYGWILEIKTSKRNEAELKLLRTNLNYVTPV